MSGLFSPEDRISVQEGWYGCHEVKRDDIALVQIGGRTHPLIKMVRVLPGDRFKLKKSVTDEGEILVVNGQVLRTQSGAPYVFRGKRAKMLRLYEKIFKGIMPAETYFVFGTVSGGSYDSTRFGAIRKTQLIARAIKIKN